MNKLKQNRKNEIRAVKITLGSFMYRAVCVSIAIQILGGLAAFLTESISPED